MYITRIIVTTYGIYGCSYTSFCELTLRFTGRYQTTDARGYMRWYVPRDIISIQTFCTAVAHIQLEHYYHHDHILLCRYRAMKK